MIVVLGLLTADGNNNNGWLGGSDASTEVRIYSHYHLYDANIRITLQGTWTWNDNVAFSYTNWWTGETKTLAIVSLERKMMLIFHNI